MAIDGQQNIWCATHGGLYLFNTSKKKFTAFLNTEKGQANANRVNYLMLDRQGLLWLCTFEGLWSFNPGQRVFKKEIHPGNDPLYEELFTSVLEDHNGKIWAGCWSRGLKELDRLSGKVVTHLPGKRQMVSCITEVLQSPGHYVLWLNGALTAYDPREKKFFVYGGP